MKNKTFYKKIVNYKKNKESNGFLYGGIICLGVIMGWILRMKANEPNDLFFIIIFLLLSITLPIINYFTTHDRKVKYEKFEVKSKN